MTISIQLTQIPQNENVVTRIVNLPINGGSIGRSFQSTVQLPDQTQQISRIHGDISQTDEGYLLTDKSQNGIQINSKKLPSGASRLLKDGDILSIGGYTLLISALGETFKTNTVKIPDMAKDNFTEPNFSLDLNSDNELDFLQEEHDPALNLDNNPLFSSKGVLSDDPFNDDPFMDIAPEPDDEPLDIQPSEQEFMPVHPAVNPETEALSKRVDQLIALTQKNNQTLQDPIQTQEILFASLEQTLEQFLNEFSPVYLEQMFAEYSSGFFANKEKKYWRIYRKHFDMKKENGDFNRQFKALFLENMHKQGVKR